MAESSPPEDEPRLPHRRVLSATRSPRVLGEFLLIVAGVTVALAADSLWSFRQDRVLEAEYLEQLRSDLDENRDRLIAAIEDEETIGDGAFSALSAVKGGETISPDSARAWLVEQRGFYYADPRLLTGTFSGLVESGDLRMIRDPDVRKSILGYLPQIQADRVEFDRWVDAFITGIRPYRTVLLRLPKTERSLAEGSVQALSTFPGHPLLAEALDAAIWSNEIRLIYLRRMLVATETVAETLASS